MADFVSSFWNWFIIVPTVVGLAAVAWLAYVNTHRKAPGTEDQTVGHVWDEDLEEYDNPLPRWWLNMLYITIVFGVIYLLLYPGLGSFQGLLGWSQLKQYGEEIETAAPGKGHLAQGHEQAAVGAVVVREQQTVSVEFLDQLEELAQRRRVSSFVSGSWMRPPRLPIIDPRAPTACSARTNSRWLRGKQGSRKTTSTGMGSGSGLRAPGSYSSRRACRWCKPSGRGSRV